LVEALRPFIGLWVAVRGDEVLVAAPSPKEFVAWLAKHHQRAQSMFRMLACYLLWHLRQAWAPLTFTDENPPARGNPVTPARRSAAAAAKAARKTGPGNQPIRSFRDLLDHLATLTRDTVRVGGQPVDKLASPTPDQRRAFDLIGAPIPLTLT
jgi:hypothetical protein